MGSLTNCIDCGHVVSTRAFECPNCGAPRRERTGLIDGAIGGCSSGCLFVVLLVVVVPVLFAVLYPADDRPNKAMPVQPGPIEPENPQPDLPLPPHRFQKSSRLGVDKSQVRAVIEPGSMTQHEVRELALQICKKYEAEGGGTFLVRFFGSGVELEEWDGTDQLLDHERPQYICHVTVETNESGELYAALFEFARDPSTGKFRTDGIKP